MLYFPLFIAIANYPPNISKELLWDIAHRCKPAHQWTDKTSGLDSKSFWVALWLGFNFIGCIHNHTQYSMQSNTCVTDIKIDYTGRKRKNKNIIWGTQRSLAEKVWQYFEQLSEQNDVQMCKNQAEVRKVQALSLQHVLMALTACREKLLFILLVLAIRKRKRFPDRNRENSPLFG